MELANPQPIPEKRKQYRLPYESKILLLTQTKSSVAYASNLSFGGLFISTLNFFPVNQELTLYFTLPNSNTTLSAFGRVAHVVLDREHCEVECGMGIQFNFIKTSHQNLIIAHIEEEKKNYLELKKILDSKRPNQADIDTYVKRLPYLQKYQELLVLTYRVNRIATLFLPPDIKQKTLLAS